jgi:hypothetical protein
MARPHQGEGAGPGRARIAGAQRRHGACFEKPATAGPSRSIRRFVGSRRGRESPWNDM